MIVKKLCTKHGVEYTGDMCPECAKNEGKHDTGRRPAVQGSPGKAKKSVVPDGNGGCVRDIEGKLKALVDKWKCKSNL